MNLSEKITRYRSKHNLSQGEFAKAVGISTPTAVLAERGGRLSPKKKMDIELFLERDIEESITFTGNISEIILQLYHLQCYYGDIPLIEIIKREKYLNGKDNA